MDVLARGALPPFETLRELWHSASLRSAWLYSDDWYHPEVDAILISLAEGQPPLAACVRLGNARALAGCGIAETIDDLMCLFTAIDMPTPADLVRSLTIGWVHADIAGPAVTGCIDPGSGLYTRAYLAERLREIYGAADPDGTTPSRTHVLLMLDIGMERLAFHQQAAREAGIGEILRKSFPVGHPIAALGNGRYAALVRVDDDPASMLKWLQGRIEREAAAINLGPLLRTPPRLWIADLPAEADEGVTMVLDMDRG